MNNWSLNHKHILVTGASSGMGKEISVALSSLGAELILTARNEQRLQSVFESLSGEGNKYIICDLDSESDINHLAEEIHDLDGIVYCAGINEYSPIKYINFNKAEKIFRINYFSQIILTQKLLKLKKLNNSASLVFISSISSSLGVPGTLLYASSKSALNASVRVMAAELAPFKIRVNAICPGIVRTHMIEENGEIDLTEFNNQEKDYPLGFGTPLDVANAVVYHLSEASRWLTGNLMTLDGGYTLK